MDDSEVFILDIFDVWFSANYNSKEWTMQCKFLIHAIVQKESIYYFKI